MDRVIPDGESTALPLVSRARTPIPVTNDSKVIHHPFARMNFRRATPALREAI
jgi:hypothetical protein